jgi:uncharacterized membrane protein YeaQ/YmgE (transglycosylase-associated protein family)
MVIGLFAVGCMGKTLNLLRGVMHPPLGWLSCRWGGSRLAAEILIRFEEVAVEIIGVILAGIVIGLLGKFIAPGNRDNIPIWLTIICGIAGVLIGWFIYTAFGGNGSPGIDWVRWIIAIAVAAVLVMIASAVTARSRSRAL